MARIKKTVYKRLYFRYHNLVKYVMMLGAILFISLVLPKQARFKFEYDKGKVWTQKDLVSPFAFAIQKTPEQIENERKQIIKSVKPIYTYQDQVEKSAIEEFTIALSAQANQWQLSQQAQKEYTLLGVDLLQRVYQKGITHFLPKYQQIEPYYNFVVVNNGIATEKNTLDVVDAEGANKLIKAAIEQQVVITQKQAFYQLITQFVAENIVFNERLTDKLEKEAYANISPAIGMVQKGELIISNGDIINAETFQKLESLRVAFEGDPLLKASRQWLFIGQLILVGLIVSLLMIFLNLFRKDIFQDHRKLSLILLVICGMLVTLSWAIKLNVPNIYFIPYCIVPIIIRIL
ncbi:MAG: transmembrane HD family protein, partial [Sphingobacteriaceae bacterium]